MEEKIHYDQQYEITHIQLNQKHYSMANCKWINRYSNKKKSSNYPTKRYNHGAVIYNNHLYLFGGIQRTKSFQYAQNNLYKLDINNWLWQIVSPQINPTSRDSFGYCLNKDNFIIFGGCNQQIVYNDMWIFNFQTNTWQEIEQKGVRPRQREMCHLINYNQKNIFLFGGMNPKMEIIFNEIYMFSLQNLTWQKFASINPPKQRILQTYAKCKDKIYLFGGYQLSKKQNFCDDLYQLNFNFQNKSVQYKKIQTINKPPGRCAHGFIQFGDKFLVLLGGQGQNQKQENQEKQKQIKQSQKEEMEKQKVITDQLKQKEKEKKEIQQQKQKQQKQKQKEILRVKQTRNKSNQKQKAQKLEKQKIQKQKLERLEKQRLQKQKLERQLLQQLEKQRQEEQKRQKNKIKQESKQQQIINVRNDVWVYNIEKRIWINIQPKNVQFRPRLGFSVCKSDNKIFIFGGMRQNGNLYDQLMILTFLEIQSQPKNVICQSCIKHQIQERQKECMYEDQKYSDFLPVMSNNFIYNIALIQHFAFNAIALIIDSAIIMASDFVRVGIRKRISQLSYIAIQFSGQGISNKEFIELMSNKQTQRTALNEFANNLKFGSFRLGRTFIYINREKNIIQVALFSVNSNIVPNCESQYKYFGYIQNTSTGFFLTENGLQNKNHIENFLKSQVQNHAQLLKQTSKHSIYIFQMNLIMTSKNIYYYELITNHPSDIRILVNHRKIDFLDELGYNISQQPDISLRSYLSLLYLNSKIRIYLNDSIVPLEFFNYRQVLQQNANKNLIERIKVEVSLPEIKQIQLYRVNQLEQPNESNFGLLLYQNDRLIMRYDTDFGKLFCDKFYKNKYKKKRFHIFKYLGVIEFNSEFLKANIVKTNLENNHFAIPFWSKLKNILKQQKTILYRAPPVDAFNQDNIQKKVKLN